MNNYETKPVLIKYKNYKGVTSHRVIRPRVIRFGVSEWHKEEGWLLEAWDLRKKAKREFAMQDISLWIDGEDANDEFETFFKKLEKIENGDVLGIS